MTQTDQTQPEQPDPIGRNVRILLCKAPRG